MGRNVLVMLFILALGAPLFAQDAKETEKPADDTKESEAEQGETDDGEKEEAKKPERKMTDAGKKLFEDCERCYTKYYEILLKKFKADESYKAEDIWNDAVKEAKNAEYKDGNAFKKAMEEMQRKDRVFKKKLSELMVKKANENAEAIKKWTRKQRE